MPSLTISRPWQRRSLEPVLPPEVDPDALTDSFQQPGGALSPVVLRFRCSGERRPGRGALLFV